MASSISIAPAGGAGKGWADAIAFCVGRDSTRGAPFTTFMAVTRPPASIESRVTTVPSMPRLRAVAAFDAGEQLKLGGPKQRLILAMLLAAEGSSVSTGALIDGLWGSLATGKDGASAQEGAARCNAYIRGCLSSY